MGRMTAARADLPVRLLGPALLGCLVLGAAFADEVQFRRQFVDGRHGQVHVLTSRPASEVELRTPYVCLAPNPMAGRYFREFMKVLGTDRLMIAPDYPGLGESNPSATPLDMAGYAASMAETLEALGYGPAGNGRVDVSGYHTGAFVALELAASRPDLVRKVVLMGVPFYTGEARKAQYEETVVATPLEEDFDSVRKWWEFAVTSREQGVTLERGYDNFVDVLKPKYRHSWPYRAVFTYPAEERAPLVRQPVLILNTHGGLAEQTRAIAPYFADARLVEIPQLHHGIFDVGPDILAGHARPFLDGSD
jgi:pimeloyl-ACP methyl ester carboxylesterase